jgi:MarR family
VDSGGPGAVHELVPGWGPRHPLAAEAAVLIDPASGVEPCLGENRLAAGEEVAEAIGEPLVRARRAAIGGAIAGPDRAEAGDFSALADRLEQGAATETQIADQIGPARRAYRRLSQARHLKWGIRPLSPRVRVYMTSQSRNGSLLYMHRDGTPAWSFLTNHAQVLLCIAHDPGVRLREIGEAIGITERAAHRIVAELVAAGYISRRRNGRRNHYTIQSHLPLPDPLAREQKIGDLLAILAGQRLAETNG